MKDNINHSIKEIVEIINSYAEHEVPRDIEKIENEFKILFEAQVLNFWKVDVKKSMLKHLDGDKKKTFSLESSLTKQAIDSKNIVIENHVSSDKYYNASVDNPLSLKIKSLIIFPILKDKEVVGVLQMLKGIKQRKMFSKLDEKKLNHLAPLMIAILENIAIDKDEMLDILGENKKDITKKYLTKGKVKTKTSVVHTVDITNKEYAELNALKLELIALKKEHKHKMNMEKDKVLALETANKVLRKSQSATQGKEKIAKYHKELEYTRVKYKELEALSLEIYTESQAKEATIKGLEKDLRLLQKENINLQSDLKKKVKQNTSKSIKSLKAEQSFASQEKTRGIGENIEHVLEYVDNDFGANQYVYMLFELILYAMHSEKGMTYIEESVKKSKLVQQIIDGYYFKGDIDVYNEKNRISKLVEHIKNYEQGIFLNTIKLNITVEDTMPISLVFDRVKIQSCILHLLTDLHRFVDNSRNLNINLTFKDKFLNVELGGYIHNNNNLFHVMFKQSKHGGSEKDRIGLQLTKKMITRLKGEISYLHEDNYYTFILKVPTQVIKI